MGVNEILSSDNVLDAEKLKVMRKFSRGSNWGYDKEVCVPTIMFMKRYESL
jgi:hypothetical protein